jgi:uncharacterized membrane protein
MKGRSSVKKLLSVSFCIAIVCALGVSINGCKPPDKAGSGDAKKELKASTPEKQTIKQGKEGTAKITYTVGTEATAKKIEAKSDNDKVTVKVAPDKFEKGKGGDVTVTVTVADDAKEGDVNVTVTATGDNSTPATLDTKFVVKVEKK